MEVFFPTHFHLYHLYYFLAYFYDLELEISIYIIVEKYIIFDDALQKYCLICITLLRRNRNNGNIYLHWQLQRPEKM